ncbi:MAG: HNH endonuclease [Acidobacteriota bacterium]|nr:HNH endonuclease [Acidobacteriota bacterium]
MNRHYLFVAERAGYRCEYCQAPEQAFNFHFEIEHILPRSREGSGNEDNIALACTACNLFKSDHLSAFDELTQSNASLFHPRGQSWDEHFWLNQASGEVEGLTATGRATIACLRINSTEQLRSRRLWIALGLFS